MRFPGAAGLMGALALVLLAPEVHAEPTGRITGFGGLFVRSKDPKALAAWYRDVLGVPVERWGGAKLPHGPPTPAFTVWAAFPESSSYMAPSSREFMVDFVVDDLGAFLERLRAKGVAVLKEDASAEGRFAWILDPDGTKIELWQPKTP